MSKTVTCSTCKQTVEVLRGRLKAHFVPAKSAKKLDPVNVTMSDRCPGSGSDARPPAEPAKGK